MCPHTELPFLAADISFCLASALMVCLILILSPFNLLSVDEDSLKYSIYLLLSPSRLQKTGSDLSL